MKPAAGRRRVGKLVDPPALTGRETTPDLLKDAFPAFAGRMLREAHGLMRESLAPKNAVFLTMSGGMTPAGLHASCIVPLIRSGAIACIATTAANVYHDVQRALGATLHEVNPAGDDRKYRRERMLRVYDVGFDEDTLTDVDTFLTDLLKTKPFQRDMTTPEFHHEIGRALALVEKQRGAERESLLATCFRYEVPIFVGAPQDGGLYLNVVKLARQGDKAFRFRIDATADVYTMAALQHGARKDDGQTAIWVLGGGVPKNYTLQAAPLLAQVLGVDARGFDISVQICGDVPDSGAHSPGTAGEEHTWGRVSGDCVDSRNVYVRADVTIAMPLLASALLADPGLRREPMRLYRRIPDAVRDLDAAWIKQPARVP